MITIIDMTSRQIVHKMSFAMEINEMAWSPTGSHLYMTTGLGTVDLLKLSTMTVSRSLIAHTANCYCIEFSPDEGRRFAVGGADAIVSIWDAIELACIRTLCRLE